MKKMCIVLMFMQIGISADNVQRRMEIPDNGRFLHTQWNGKRMAYLGDSITDSMSVRGTKLYWGFLQDLLGIEPLVYGINGHEWNQVYGQAEKLFKEQGRNVDAIMIFAGTNDYNHGIPIGSFFEEEEIDVETSGPKIVKRLHRKLVMADSTFCGRMNKVLFFLKECYPDKQIILLTPLHRGYAKFSDNNIQPDEYYCNAIGLFLESYVEAVKQAGKYWSVPVIDLYATCGLLPNLESQTQYISKEATDRLHPNTAGHYRIAKTLQYGLVGLSSSF